MSDMSIGRRGLLAAGGATALATGLGAVASPASAAPASGKVPAGGVAPSTLRFRRDGGFTVLQFNDTQDGPKVDKRTIQLIETAAKKVRPDLIVLVGDNTNGDAKTWEEHKQAINNIASTFESTGIPWAVTFGNHDEDSTPTSGMDEAKQLAFYMKYGNNLNVAGPKGVTGTGNMYLPIRSSKGKHDAYGIWMIDSGRYAPKTMAGQDFEGYPTWDWVRMDQVDWYYRLSEQLEAQRRRKVPSYLFQHIALWEYRFMWWGGVDGRTDADHQRGLKRHGIVGQRNEDECPGPFNSGLFNAIIARGETEGVSIGHDHINTYHGDYYGVTLAYGPGSGYGTYGLKGAEKNHLRGGRVFQFKEDAKGVGRLAETYNVFAKDYGIDVTEADQKREPLALPEWAKKF